MQQLIFHLKLNVYGTHICKYIYVYTHISHTTEHLVISLRWKVPEIELWDFFTILHHSVESRCYFLYQIQSASYHQSNRPAIISGVKVVFTNKYRGKSICQINSSISSIRGCVNQFKEGDSIWSSSFNRSHHLHELSIIHTYSLRSACFVHKLERIVE